MGLGDAALATKLALLFIFLGFIVHVIGFGAPYWQVVLSTDFYHGGLWQTCTLGICQDFDTDQLTNVGCKYIFLSLVLYGISMLGGGSDCD